MSVRVWARACALLYVCVRACTYICMYDYAGAVCAYTCVRMCVRVCECVCVCLSGADERSRVCTLVREYVNALVGARVCMRLWVRAYACGLEAAHVSVYACACTLTARCVLAYMRIFVRACAYMIIILYSCKNIDWR